MMRVCCVLALAASVSIAAGAESLPPLKGRAPQSVEDLFAGYDPRAEPLEVSTVREWVEDGLVLRYVVFTVGTFKGTRARMAAFHAFPKDGKRLPALLHMHGGGQRAFQNEVKRFAARGYACLSVNWGGREMEDARPGDENTDWGAVDPTQKNVSGYSSLLPKPNTIDAVESPRNCNWFLLTVGCRRALTFLEKQSEVDPDRLGVYGHSMGGQLTVLVAGSDDRVKAACPSVGGCGFLQTDFAGLPGSARTVSGDLALFTKTLAAQAYLARVRCPILFLTSTNDFNAPLDFVARGMALVPHADRRTVIAPHLNHRFTPEAEVSRALWFDAVLQRRLTVPAEPKIAWVFDRERGVPALRVTPDGSRAVERVDIYYGYERDPRNRFWADAGAVGRDGSWQGDCPVFDLDEPLFAFADVHYRLEPGERREGDPSTFTIAAFAAMPPAELRRNGVRATETQRRLIDDFARGLHDWYVLNGNNRHHWFFATRKLVDPRWEAPKGAALSFEIETTQAACTLAVQLRTDTWRSYVGRKAETYTARMRLAEAGRRRVELKPADFVSPAGVRLTDWFGITELVFCSADKAQPDDKSLKPWAGSVPRLFDLRWNGGEPTRRRKAFPGAKAGGPASDGEFQKAIDESIRREQFDRKKP